MIAAREHQGAATVSRAAVRRPWLIAGASGLATGAAVFPFTAKPLRWDEWVYMGLAFYPRPLAWVLNRYAHVYLLKPFMWLAGDPYIGARVYWSALFGITVAALIWLCQQLPAQRASVLVLTLFLFMGQQALFAYPGVAYADYALMALFTLTSAFVFARIVNGADLSRRDAAVLGALFWISVRAKETALPLACLGAVLLLTPSGRLRDRREALRLARAGIAGVVAAMLGFMLLDALVLRDPLFSVRITSWRALLGYNTRPFEYHAPEYGWLSLLLRPEHFVSFALYAGAGLLWARRERDRRLLVVYALPALFVLQLAVVGTFAAAPVIARYVIPILPLLSFLAAFAYARVAHDAGRANTVLTRLATVVATLAILISGAFPIGRVVEDLATHRAQREGEARFAGFYQVARAVRADRDAVVFVSRNLYGGAIRPLLIPDITRMNFNVPLRPRPIADAAWPPPPHADFAIVSFDEYQQWLAGPDADRERALVSDDRMVALICLRAPCPLR